jgi:hypothetical protein
LYPTTAPDELGFHARLTLCAEAVAPLPVNDSVTVEPDPVVNLKLAVAVPLAPGLKTTVKDLLCPAPSASGYATPDTANSLVLTAPDVIVTLAPPAVNVPVILF